MSKKALLVIDVQKGYMNDKNKKAVAIYDQTAEKYAQSYDPIRSGKDMIFPRTFVDILEPGAYIIDLGCGTGYSAGYFVKHGMKAQGADLSTSMLKIAKRNYPDIPFTQADMREFDPGKKVDGVWAGYSMFHFDQNDFEKTVEKIRSYLKPGGIFGLVMQEGEGEGEFDEPLIPDETVYLHLYTEEQLREILGQHGFEVVEVKRKPPLYEQEFPFNKLLLVAKRI